MKLFVLKFITSASRLSVLPHLKVNTLSLNVILSANQVSKPYGVLIMDQTTLPEPAFNMYSKRIFSFPIGVSLFKVSAGKINQIFYIHIINTLFFCFLIV